MTEDSSNETTRMPEEGEEVFVTVGTALPMSKRAVVRGHARDVKENLFRVEHKELVRVGAFENQYEHPEEAMLEGRGEGSKTSGHYGPGVNETYGEEWAFNRNELPI